MTAPDPAATKQVLRKQLKAARRERPVAERLADDRARTALVLAALRDVEPSTISLYLSTPPHAAQPEPGTIELATALHTLGHTVLCPVLSPVDGKPRHDPAWAVFEGPASLRPGLWGIPEPTGEVLDATALGRCDLVICSALAVTREGVRIGVGGGWYDRALQHRRDDADTWALVGEDELVEELPREEHDVLVDAVVTPTRFVTCQHS